MRPERPLLSATVITYNEADRLADCLASLDFCDEVLVVDSGSTDTTCDIAQAHGARVLTRPFDGFRSQKQYAVEQAAHDWILSLDADERIDARLREAIVAERDAGFARAVLAMSALARKNQAKLQILTLKGQGTKLARAFKDAGYNGPVQNLEVESWK